MRDDDARVLHRDKHVSKFMPIVLGGVGLFEICLAVFIAFANASSDKPVPAEALPFVVGGVALMGVMMALLGLMFAVVRTLVTEREVQVKYGLWGPRIPLDAIAACSVVDYKWTEFGGWGIRLGRGGSWAYVPAGAKRVVELRYREDATDKRVLVGVTDPDEMARQINRARSRIGGARIAESEQEAIDEALAEEEAAQEERRVDRRRS